jgi:hypothetical protein
MQQAQRLLIDRTAGDVVGGGVLQIDMQRGNVFATSISSLSSGIAPLL